LSNSLRVSRTAIGVVLALVVACGAGLFFLLRPVRPPLPDPGSDIYARFTRAFYHGLAAMQVGLLDDARVQLTTATETIPGEASAWADLALAHMRLGDLVAAEAPLARARELAPDDTAILLMAGRMETARGRLDEGIALLRQAVRGEQDGIRARVALAEELERAGGEAAENEALQVLDESLERSPSNLFLIVERARIAARRGDSTRLTDSLARMKPFAASWPPIAAEQYENLQRAATAGSLPDTSRASNLLRNVLARVPTFIEGLAAVRTPAELIAEPIERYIALASPPSTPAASDASLSYGSPTPLEPSFLLDRPGVLHVDWNHDFLLDRVLVEEGNLRLELQGPEGVFTDRTPADGPTSAGDVWAADVEMDGDIDLIAVEGNPLLLRNNGDGTWRNTVFAEGIPGAEGFAWADLDRDADPDAVFVDEAGRVHVFENRQAGDFTRVPVPEVGPIAAIAVADLDADGGFDIVMLDSGGAIKRMSNLRDVVDVARWTGMPRARAGSARLLAGDLDNNGALDLVVTTGGDSRIWLANARHAFEPVAASPRADVVAIVDTNGDGLLDLAALQERVPVRLTAKAGAGYHWKQIQPRAQQSAGDQRINSFGIGGEIEARSGLLVQKQVIAGPVVHIGLGTRETIDVVRILWPNGVPQAEFGSAVDDALVAEQRLKGSCPWVFAWDGTRINFVTDFLWRSPLGLRINAQDTAGVVQTEDWVRISGDQLVAKDGAYDLRITAELWETHYFDHVSLMVVDHPADTEIFVDERFSATAPPALEVYAFRDLEPVDGAWDDRGRNVTSLVAAQDGRYLATFERGAYQGIARDHAVEFEVGDLATNARSPLSLIANGWIYPTDSSINVAIGQGGTTAPSGLALDVMDAEGRWHVINGDLGFPAGKNKTVLVSLAGLAGARRLRLRTNLEIYWDYLAVATPADAEIRTVRLGAASADLRFRGFSRTSSPRGEAPEIPDYAIVESRAQRWRDLTGYHTRFGDVRELLDGVDDRYVIMNAGDEMQLLFPAQPSPAAGLRRDFVLIGDGWEKDGDYNTGHSQTVLPLPSHDEPAYGSAATTLELEDDPVYLRHRADWERFHTRYVTPRAFVQGLRR
jgi:tetratricopeptide (TPR) repeat protein